MSKHNYLTLTLLGAGIALVIVALAVFGNQNPSTSFARFKAQNFASGAGPDQKQGPVVTASPSSSARPATPSPTISPANTATYKVSGTLTLGPTSPVCSVSKPCTAPIANHEVDIVGSIPAKTYSDAQGRFTVYLPPGNYSITLNPQVGQGNKSWPFTVTNQPVTLPISVDSGMR